MVGTQNTLTWVEVFDKVALCRHTYLFCVQKLLQCKPVIMPK